MGQRYRTRNSNGETTGTYRLCFVGQDNTVEKTRPVIVDSEECADAVGLREQDNSLDLSKYNARFPSLSGELIISPTAFALLQDWPIDYGNMPCDPSTEFPVLTEGQLGNYAWATASRTNPSRGTIGIPTMIGELKDVPDLVKKWGNNLYRKYANSDLWYRFGAMPMARDMQKLCRWTRTVNKTMRALRKLKHEGFLSRRCPLGSSSTPETLVHQGLLNSSCGAMLQGKRFIKYSSEMWGSCRWEVTADTSIPSDNPELELLARQVMTGYTLNGVIETAWELFPWSWMADWFWSLQSLIGASANHLRLQQNGICIMRTSSAKSRYEHDPTSQTKFDNFRVVGRYYEECVRKERYPILLQGVPTATMPALSLGQWSILGSLTILRIT
jgi:hypothetical protein